MLKTLDLFSGIGGFAVGLEATNFFKTTCFVEQEPYCKEVLRHHFPEVPILGDIKNVKRSDLPDPDPDVILGGFPCQPFSSAGLQKAQSDSRHLWPEMFRLIKECRPSWVIGENVIGIVKLGLDEVLTDLENEGYATRTFNIPACAIGAPHLRQRVWIIAHNVADPSISGLQEYGYGQAEDAIERSKDVADPQSKRHGRGSSKKCGNEQRIILPKEQEGGEMGREAEGCGEPYRPDQWWESEPPVGRLAHGVPNRVSQIRALGNSIIPQIAKEIGNAIKTAETTQP
jgi:DNA (cytosine-5)-methyltransferase 1